MLPTAVLGTDVSRMVVVTWQVGLTVLASGRQECNGLKTRMAATYGHLTNHLHQVGRTYHRPLET